MHEAESYRGWKKMPSGSRDFMANREKEFEQMADAIDAVIALVKHLKDLIDVQQHQLRDLRERVEILERPELPETFNEKLTVALRGRRDRQALTDSLMRAINTDDPNARKK